MPLAAMIPGLIGAGASIIGGALQGHTTTTTPTFSPEMLQLQRKLLGYSDGLMDGTGPQVMTGLNQINQGFAQMPGKITSQLAGKGFGKSGKLGTALYDTENARLNSQSQFRGQMAGQGASLGEQLLSMGRGQSTTTPGGPLSDGLMSGGNALQNLSTLLMLKNVLGGQNSGSGPVGGYPSGYDSGSGIPGGVPQPLPYGGGAGAPPTTYTPDYNSPEGGY